MSATSDAMNSQLPSISGSRLLYQNMRTPHALLTQKSVGLSRETWDLYSIGARFERRLDPDYSH
jgi:hypothetical protein